MPTSLAQLDRFERGRSLDITLAAYVKEDVVVRSDPADLVWRRIFSHDHFLCAAVNTGFSGQVVVLREINKVRADQRTQM